MRVLVNRRHTRFMIDGMINESPYIYATLNLKNVKFVYFLKLIFAGKYKPDPRVPDDYFVL